MTSTRPEAATKLTKRAVDQALPSDARYFVWDSELKGFAIRVAPSGTKTYIVRYRPRGDGRLGPKRFVVVGRHGPLTPEQARMRAREILGAVAAGRDPAAERAQTSAAMTVAALVELFVSEHAAAKRKPRTATGYAAVLNSWVVPKLGKRAAQAITQGEISQLHLAMKARPYQANRMLAIVASMYGFAVKRGLVSKGTNPTDGVVRYRERSRERYLTTEELGRLGETLRLAETAGLPWVLREETKGSKHLAKAKNQHTLIAPEVCLAFRLLLLTGARLREILHLEWRHVDLERGLLLLPDSKTGRKTIVLSSPAIGLIRFAPKRGPYVITGADGERPRSDLKRPWRAIQQHAGLDGVRIHDLRHTFASIGAGASLGLPIVGKLLGHSQPATTARYAHLDADPLRRATDLIGSRISEALER